MKKISVFVLLLLSFSFVFAAESEPSDVVGFVKITSRTNSWTMFSLPFNSNGDLVSSEFSDNLGNPFITGGPNPVFSDQIVEVGTGTTAWYNSNSNSWFGDFNVDVSKPYYGIIRADHPTSSLYMYGSINNNIVTDYDPIPGNSWTAIGYNEVEEILVSDLGLISAGFEGGPNPVFSDQIVEVGTGTTAWYNSNNSTWFGDFTISPGKAYYIIVRNGHNGLSNYSYPPANRNNNENSFNTNTSKNNRRK